MHDAAPTIRKAATRIVGQPVIWNLIVAYELDSVDHRHAIGIVKGIGLAAVVTQFEIQLIGFVGFIADAKQLNESERIDE